MFLHTQSLENQANKINGNLKEGMEHSEHSESVERMEDAEHSEQSEHSERAETQEGAEVMKKAEHLEFSEQSEHSKGAENQKGAEVMKKAEHSEFSEHSEYSKRAEGMEVADDAGNVAAKLAEAERRGFMRAMSLKAEELFNRPRAGSSMFPEPDAEESAASDVIVLSHMRRSVWD